jgi:hypothetical protein
MKSRLLATLALTVTAAVAAVGLSSPAQAEVPGYVKVGAYGWPEQCANIGYTGVVNHTWSVYYCETVSPASWDGPGLYYLWAY